jgi:hypothetical protein
MSRGSVRQGTARALPSTRWGQGPQTSKSRTPTSSRAAAAAWRPRHTPAHGRPGANIASSIKEKMWCATRWRDAKSQLLWIPGARGSDNSYAHIPSYDPAGCRVTHGPLLAYTSSGDNTFTSSAQRSCSATSPSSIFGNRALRACTPAFFACEPCHRLTAKIAASHPRRNAGPLSSLNHTSGCLTLTRRSLDIRPGSSSSSSPAAMRQSCAPA